MYVKGDAAKICKRYSQLKTDRSLWDSYYDRIREWFRPNMDEFSAPGTKSPGQINDQHIFNSKGKQSGEKLADILYSSMVPVHEQFFTLVPSQDADEEKKNWCHKATEILTEELSNSNLPQIARETLQNIVFFGTGITYSFYEDDELVFNSFNPEGFYIDTDYKGRVNTVAFTSKHSAKSVVEQYGEECVCPDTLKKSQQTKQTEIEILQYFERTIEGKWSLCVVNLSKKHLIKEYDFSSNPIQAGRWKVMSYEKYGRSPAMDALHDVYTINEVDRTVLRASKKHIDPPIALPYDASMQATELAWDTNPGGVVEVMADATGAFPTPQLLMLGGDITVGQYQLDKLDKTIEEYFLLDILTVMMETRTDATATQINEISAEKLDLIVPIVVGLIDSWVKPLVENALTLLIENGKIQSPMEDFDADIEIQSSLLIKRKQAKLRNAIQVTAVINQMAQIDPNVNDRINYDELVALLVYDSAIPNSVIRGGQELKEYRNQKAEAQQMQMQQQTSQGLMDNLSKNVDPNEPIKEGSVVGEMLNGG